MGQQQQEQNKHFVVTWQPGVAKRIRDRLKIHDEKTKDYPFNVPLMFFFGRYSWFRKIDGL